MAPTGSKGPTFEKKHEIYAAKPQNMEGYADNFFNWVYDFNGDGANDVFVVGFPGTPAYVYENPKGKGLAKHWKKHQVFESVSNESPQLIDIVGDKRPELVCTLEGAFGFATINWDQPFEPWTFHRVSDQAAPERFGHGLGVGDINGDALADIIFASGWFEQPKKAPRSPAGSSTRRPSPTPMAERKCMPTTSMETATTTSSPAWRPTTSAWPGMSRIGAARSRFFASI